MNYKNLKITKNFSKVVKNLTVCVALILSFLTIFSSKESSSNSLPACSSFTITSADAKPGNNCLFVANKPLCQNITTATYTIPPASYLTSGQVHRVNCYDLSDMPLCSQLKEELSKPAEDIKNGLNCATECSSIETLSGSAPENRGITYAVHNRDCVRFCDSVDSENTKYSSSIAKTEGVTCVSRKCHQLDEETLPNKNSNCNQLPCNLLSVEELVLVISRSKYANNQNYCDALKDINDRVLKCYKFSLEQLPYTLRSKMCVVHNCQPSCKDTYVANTDVNGDGEIKNFAGSNDSDDTLNIPSDTSTYSQSYKSTYEEHINYGSPITSSNYCNPIICKPIIKNSFRCTDVTTDGTKIITGDDAKDTNRNDKCDSSGKGSECSGNFCYKTIDCNKSENSSMLECKVSDDRSDPVEDTMDSWFYRPKPMNKAVQTNGILREKIRDNGNGDICYKVEDLEYYSTDGSPSENKKWGMNPEIIFYLPTKMPPFFEKFSYKVGYFLTYLSPNTTKSPGLCNPSNDGDRGIGYLYLCGNKGNLYNPLADYTAFHKGYVNTTFTEKDGADDAYHEVVVCLRFKNSMRPDDLLEDDSETCGSRECGISCGFSKCKSQTCGYDICKKLTITDLNPKECEMSKDLGSDSSSSEEDSKFDQGDCMATIDGKRLRLRIQKYGDKICSYLDAKSHTAYPSAEHLFARGNEKLEDGKTCISGTSSSGNDCNGKDSADSPGATDVWRTMKFKSGKVNIPYIQDNRKTEPRGYIDKKGEFFAEQECIKTSLRFPPPNHFNLANSQNSPKLFNPPIFIKNSYTKKGSEIISIPNKNDYYGLTDFNYPEILISFGSSTVKLSLKMGYNGFEEDDKKDPDSKVTITTNLNSINYSADVFVRKEFDRTTETPIFCLYTKVKDSARTVLAPKRIECVPRKFPEINSPSLMQKIKIYPDGSNTFDKAKINLKYSSFGANEIDENCSSPGDDNCSSEISLENADISKPTCNEDANNNLVEGYKVCAQREECTKLNIECIKNEVEMQTAKLKGDSIDSFLAVRRNCNEFLLPRCNERMGATKSSAALSILDNVESRTGNAHGWFNEICFVSGDNTKSFNNSLKQVVAYDLGSVLGKCLIDTVKSADKGEKCKNGGEAPDCICLEYTQGAKLGSGLKRRTQTPHEAGLCVTIDKPQTCPAISYTSTLNSNPNDLYYVDSSLNSSLSNNPTNIHESHKDRTSGSSSGYAEFPKSVFGAKSIEGTCRGFWKNDDSSGLSAKPTRDCQNNSGNAVWGSVSNACIRYSCPSISTSGANEEGKYLDGYGSKDLNDEKGKIDGYATWARYTKTNDEPQTTNAISCIPGYKLVGSQKVESNGRITSYTGGTLPSRICNQIGQWKNYPNEATPDDSCVRITCPAVNPPSSPGTYAPAWAQWYASGGATFTETKASISNYAITPGSTKEGTCNDKLGFFQTPGSNPPTRTCDYLGNWSEVSNKCTTTCEAIPNKNNTGADANNGFSYWAETTGVQIGGEKEETSTGCIPGYFPYPYPPLKNSDGKDFDLSDSQTQNSASVIPLTLANDTRLPNFTPSLPKRKCKSVNSEGTTSNLWYSASSSCINKCPGADSDKRIGVGKTVHNTTQGQLTVEWPSIALGGWVYKTNSYNSFSNSDTYLNGQKASDYYSGRTNGYYLLARKCNADGKWGDPIPQCATNNGEITGSYAKYSSETITGSKSLRVGATINGSDGGEATSTTCIPGYNQTRSNGSNENISSYTCQYSDDNKNIDQTYFNKKAGEPCKQYCSIATDQEFSNAKYTGASNDRVEKNTKIDLSCKTGYGNKRLASGTTDSVGDSSCGRKVTDRTSTFPSITCGDGAWSSVSNDCDACRGCTFSTNNSIDGGGYVISETHSCNNFSLGVVDIANTCTEELKDEISHNSTIEFAYKRTKRCGPKDDVRNLCLIPKLQCIDGQFKYLSYSTDYIDTYVCTKTECSSTSGGDQE